MVATAEQFIANALAAYACQPGTCLATVRTWAGIAAKYPDAATAWRHCQHKYPDRKPPEGCAVYWTGGSHGYGHIAASLGNGQIRSTDCYYSGQVDTCDLGWVERSWGLTYAGWSWEINGVTIPAGGEDMEQTDKISKWSPDDGDTGDTTVGKTLNQARGYAEDAYQRVKKLEGKVSDLQSTVDKIWQAVKS